MPMPQPAVVTGLENLLGTEGDALRGARLGLLMNQASLGPGFAYAHDLLATRFPGQLRAIFSPQHGLFGQQQANMIESPHAYDARHRLPIHSLYATTRRPTPEMLASLDVLLVDLQDVGTRVYTFIWTVSYCLQACEEAGVQVVVLDRPNPLGGMQLEGPLLDPAFASFVGRVPLPMRHGLTMGELAGYVADRLGCKTRPRIVPMRGWRRAMTFAETGLPWIAPSPNLPRLEGVALYPGGVLFEGSNLSEGRGTTTPFELVGAPFVDPWMLCDALQSFELPGVKLRPIWFTPTFDKWQGQSCGGVYLHLTDWQALRPYRLALAILASARRLWPSQFAWLPPPYEYEYDKLPIDILTGGSLVRQAVDGGTLTTDAALSSLAETPAAWQEAAASYLLYAGVGTNFVESCA